MTNLTIGQRIAQERKKKELSQVGLATILDVSRQAISKWESDAAIPEIDKLIALSKLFGVSVGWLLGVEEEPEAQENDLTENQWKTVESYIQKYQQPPKPHLTAFHYMFAIGVSVLVFLLMFSQTSQIEKLLVAQSAQMEALTSRVEAMENKKDTASQSTLYVDTLLASYTLTPAPPVYQSSIGSGDTTVTFSGVPNIWNTGDEGWLHVVHDQFEPWEIRCEWNGATLTAKVELPVDDGYEYGFSIRHADGTLEMQLLPDENAENLQTAFHITGEHEIGSMEYEDTPAAQETGPVEEMDLAGEHEIGTMEFADGAMTFKGFSHTLTLPQQYQTVPNQEAGHQSEPMPPRWRKAEYILLVNTSGENTKTYTSVIWGGEDDPFPEGWDGFTLNIAPEETRIGNIETKDTTMHAQLWLHVYLDNGVRDRYILNMYEFKDGTFVELD